MGIENRDYLRDDGRSSFGRSAGGGLEGVKWIVIVSVGVWVLQLLTRQTGVVTNTLSLGPGEVLGRFQVWRLVTYALCHDPFVIWHIFFNMFILWLVGRRLEPMYGTREFVLFYLMAVIVSGLAYLLLELVIGRVGTAIGASGAVAAAFILYAIHNPHEKWLIFFVFPVEVRWLCIAYLVLDIYPVLLDLGGGGPGDGIAHAAHLGGYFFGYLYHAKQWRLTESFGGVSLPRLPQRRRDSHLKVFDPQVDSAEMETRMDEILSKISAHGEGSLSKEERAFMDDASRRLRDRSRS